MPEKSRHLLRLRYFEGYVWKQVADKPKRVFGITYPNTSYKFLARQRSNGTRAISRVTFGMESSRADQPSMIPFRPTATSFER